MRIQRIETTTITPPPIDQIDLSLMEPLIAKYKGKKGNLIPLLQGTQELYRYIPTEAFVMLEKETGHKLSDMYGVATFYAQFRLKPVGDHIIKVCHGTACHVQNVKEVSQALEEFLNIKDGETTTDKFFTLESVACLGCCSLAPAMMIGDQVYGKLTGKSAIKIIRDFKNAFKK